MRQRSNIRQKAVQARKISLRIAKDGRGKAHYDRLSVLPAGVVLELAEAVWSIPDDVADVPDGIQNVRHLVQDVGGDELDVRDGVPHVPERVGDILNVAGNVQHAVVNVPEGV